MIYIRKLAASRFLTTHVRDVDMTSLMPLLEINANGPRHYKRQGKNGGGASLELPHNSLRRCAMSDPNPIGIPARISISCTNVKSNVISHLKVFTSSWPLKTLSNPTSI